MKLAQESNNAAYSISCFGIKIDLIDYEAKANELGVR